MTTTNPLANSVDIYPDREKMGLAAAKHAISYLQELFKKQDKARVVFACAPSQDEFYKSLVKLAAEESLPWERIEVFHMDEYVGLAASKPQSFRYYLQTHLLDHITPQAFHPIPADAPDPEKAANDYAREIESAPIDLICMGIGENGHIAFNDPPVADFNDPQLVKVVELDEACRQQQVNDGCFPDFDSVPEKAITITIPNFMNANALCCIVPGVLKAEAVRNAILGPITTTCPASILRKHPNVRIFLDPGSSNLI